jgi:hypothetical protein
VPADDGFIAKHHGLDQASLIVTRSTLPIHATMLCDRLPV